FRERMEEVRAAVGAFLVQSAGLAGERIIAFGALLSEVVVVLFESSTGIQQGFVTERDGSDIADPEVHTRRAVAGRFGDFDFDTTDNVESPHTVFVDGTHLLDVLDRRSLRA